MTSAVVRRPAVAGYFYPADPAELQRQIEGLLSGRTSIIPATAVVVPHGSYPRAGTVIAATLGSLRIPRRCVIVGPSHTTTWMPWSVMAAGAYRTPLGDVLIDEACAEALQRRCPFLETDAWSQEGEHAVEVLVPFLQRLGPPDLAIVPIIMGSEDPGALHQLAQALAQCVRQSEEPVLLIASTDLTHYQPRAQAVACDRRLIELLCALEGETLLRHVQDAGAQMCGAGAAAVVLEAAKTLGARQGTLTRYTTSAGADGDPDSVIGYAGVIIEQHNYTR